jgi:predicted DNA-binding antitoxin AbrB/MazE fold protein
MSHVITAIFEDGVFKPTEEIGSLKGKFVKLEIVPIDEKDMPVQQWIKKLMDKDSRKKITPESIFADGLTVKDYLNLTEGEKESLWNKWYNESKRKSAKIEAKELKVD